MVLVFARAHTYLDKIVDSSTFQAVISPKLTSTFGLRDEQCGQGPQF